MKCGEAHEEFSALLDGELAPEQRAALEAHLSECAECLRDLGQLQQLDRLYRALPAQRAPEDFEVRFRRAGHGANVVRFERRNLARRRVWPLLVSAATFLLVLGGVVVQLNRQTGRLGLAARDTRAPVYPVEMVAPVPAVQPVPAPEGGPGGLEAAKSIPKASMQGGELVADGGPALELATGVKAAPLEPPESAAPPPPAPPPAAPPPPAPSLTAGGATANEAAGSAGSVEAIRQKAPAPAKTMKVAESGQTEAKKSAAEVSVFYSQKEQGAGIAPAEPKALPDHESREQVMKAEPPAPAGVREEAAAASASLPLDAPAASAPAEKPSAAPVLLPESELSAPAPSPAAAGTGRELAAGLEPRSEADVLRGSNARRDVQQSLEREDAVDLAGKGAPAQVARVNAPPKPRDEGPRTIGTRRFTFREGAWYQDGYANEKPAPVKRDSQAWHKLLEEESGLAALGELAGNVVFRVDKRWYRLEP